MNWTKHGKLFDPSGVDWVTSHAQIPLPTSLEGHRYRIYFAGRNDAQRSRVGYVEVNLETREVLDISDGPVLGLGSLGAFDDSGVYPHWIAEVNGETVLYYTGWMLGERVSYYAAIGAARQQADGTFERISRAPVVTRTDSDPYIMHSPCVLAEDGTYRLWYSSATKWSTEKGSPHPHYHVRYAESSDGLRWRPDGTVSIDYSYEDEWAIARPCVVPSDGEYRMWFGYARGDQGYRIGYAESPDGRNWHRDDERGGLDVSDSGWDDEMVGYPYVFTHRGTTYMVYNGNDFGAGGFGLAELE